MLPLRWGKFWLGSGWILVVLVVVLSVMPGATELRLTLSDKTGHMLAYLVLTVWFAGVYTRSRYPWIVVGLILLGGGLEMVQRQLLHRSAEFADLVANCIGISAGIVLSLIFLGGWCLRVERLVGVDRK